MKTIYLLTLLFLTNVTNAQDFEKLKKLDTIYIKYEKKDTKSRIIFPQDENGLIVRNYIYEGSKDNAKIKITFQHGTPRAKGNEKLNNEFKHFFVKKDFLNKNSNKTINSLFIKQYQACEIYLKILNPNKIIYVIDYTECKDGKTPIYEVYPWAICNYED
ncbi:hypothetical protein ACI2LI_34675 [[Kitasatospora] papulosa]|uniref:hypothetical protein n=1 Tax=[Kitasatospora] papulosa TaxID=1464011 RepID=UPI00384D519E